MTRDQILRRVTVNFAVISGRPSESIEPSETVGSFDIDSVDAIEVAMQMERELGCEIDPELFLRGEATLGALADAMFASSQRA